MTSDKCGEQDPTLSQVDVVLRVECPRETCVDVRSASGDSKSDSDGWWSLVERKPWSSPIREYRRYYLRLRPVVSDDYPGSTDRLIG